MNETAPLVRVWDPLVRVGHWILVIAFFVAYFTEDDLLGVHVWAGYVVCIVLVVRILWGFVGPRYAQFSDFVRAPQEVFAYLRGLILFRAPRYIGHSPGGGAMVIALLLSLAATVVTGLVLYGQEHRAGPLAPLFASNAPARVNLVTNAALADEKEGARVGEAEAENEMLEEVHEFLANLTLALIIAHVLGVLLASTVHRENLIVAMITGRKRTEKIPEASS